MAKEQEVRALIRELIEQSPEHQELPFKEVIREDGVVDRVEERVQQAFELRQFVLDNIPPRMRKEILIAGGLYKPSAVDRAVWFVQDLGACKDYFVRTVNS